MKVNVPPLLVLICASLIGERSQKCFCLASSNDAAPGKEQCNAQAAECAAPDKNIDLGREVVEWIRSNHKSGGYFNTKVELRREDPSDPMSMLGFFAIDEIWENELISSIPWELIIKPPNKFFRRQGPYGEEQIEFETDERNLFCEAGYAMAREMKLGNESAYAPYVRHLLAQGQNQLPATWSRVGQKLLDQVLGSRLPPQDYKTVDDFWRNTCGIDRDDTIAYHAAMLVNQRAEDILMVPTYDFYNHRNGRWYNTEIKYAFSIGQPFETRASRKIEPGEQIYSSCYMCNRCEGRADGSFGTPNMFEEHGFVEQMPQRWIFDDGNELLVYDLDMEEAQQAQGMQAETKFRISWLNDPPSRFMLDFLRSELKRLGLIDKIVDETRKKELPDEEWSVIWQYHSALVTAISAAIEAAETGSGELGDLGTGEELNQIKDNPMTCHEYLDMKGYKDVHTKKSAYQTIGWDENPAKPDKCLDLDNIYQICFSYRPHYHEAFVHFPAVYLTEPLRRVVIVGGGDSMLLHEVLKYPDLELVLALELDQEVVRESFKYFHTQPHFDDKRVQWWFGDAVKSLQLIPREYFGTFDLVLIDLSETVMSFSVTTHLDFFEALALLLKREGILAKNEWGYFGKMSPLFENVVQLFLPNNPIICDQSWIMGSNQVNFLTELDFDVLKKGKIETLLYKPLDDANEHYALIRDFYRNDTLCQAHESKKQNLAETDGSEYVGINQRPGIFIVVEVEDVAVPLQPVQQVEAVILSALKSNVGFTPLSTIHRSSEYSPGGSIIIIAMKEGYIAAHIWPEQRYCGLDIQLWAAFGKQDQLRHALMKALGIDNMARLTSQSFRVIVNGMFGTSTWLDDKKGIGPPSMTVTEKVCSEREAVVEATEKNSDDWKILGFILAESLAIPMNEGTLTVAVLCNNYGKETCRSLATVSNTENVENVVAVWSCPEADFVKQTHFEEEGVTNILLCDGWDGLKSMFEDDVIDVFIVDPIAPLALVYEAAYIVCSKTHLGTSYLREERRGEKDALFIAPMFGPDDDVVRDTFLNICYSELRKEPVLQAAIPFEGQDVTRQIGFVSSGNPEFMHRLINLSERVRERLGRDISVKEVKGSFFFQDDYSPINFHPEDYEQMPALNQFFDQHPLGRQSVVQLGPQEEEETLVRLGASKLDNALRDTLSQSNLKNYDIKVIDDVGDGALIFAILDEGYIVLVWDGKTHISLNLFSYDEDMDHRKIVNKFLTDIPYLGSIVHVEQPRGYNGVMTFRRDIDASRDCRDKWEYCTELAGEGSCLDTDDNENEWMRDNCKKACGLCSVSRT